MVKNLPANEGDVRDMGLIPGWGRSPGGRHGNPLQYSCLENLMDRGAWWVTVHGVAKSWMRLSTHAHGRNQEKIKTKKKKNWGWCGGEGG